jgi:hypothetical protein
MIVSPWARSVLLYRLSRFDAHKATIQKQIERRAIAAFAFEAVLPALTLLWPRSDKSWGIDTDKRVQILRQ